MLKHWVAVNKQSYSLLSYAHPKDLLNLVYSLKNTFTITFYYSDLELKDSRNHIWITFAENEILFTKSSNDTPNCIDLIILEIQKYKLNLAILEIQSTRMKLCNYKSKGTNCENL